MSRRIDELRAWETMLNAGLLPLTRCPESNLPWSCECMICKRKVSPSYANVNKRGRGCKYCAGKIVDQSAAATLMITAGYLPLTPYPGSNQKPWPCIHEPCGREVAPRYANIRNGTGGCIPCGKERAAKSTITGKEEAATAVMRAAGLTPLTPYPGSKTPWLCIHELCGREVAPTHSNVNKGAGPCRYCAGLVVTHDEAAAVMRAAGIEPLGPYPGSKEPWHSRCIRCGNEVFPRHNSVQRGSGGCTHCARVCRRICPCRTKGTF